MLLSITLVINSLCVRVLNTDDNDDDDDDDDINNKYYSTAFQMKNYKPHYLCIRVIMVIKYSWGNNTLTIKYQSRALILTWCKNRRCSNSWIMNPNWCGYLSEKILSLDRCAFTLITRIKQHDQSTESLCSAVIWRILKMEKQKRNKG